MDERRGTRDERPSSIIRRPSVRESNFLQLHHRLSTPVAKKIREICAIFF
jgi:hypothetical protein